MIGCMVGCISIASTNITIVLISMMSMIVGGSSLRKGCIINRKGTNARPVRSSDIIE